MKNPDYTKGGYKDKHVELNGEWLIPKRIATFVWTDNRELGGSHAD
ncbi:hypothetical protein LL037_05595 [Clostridium estertheticum]|nr:hypothetical protein [Clostridium estertheticum]MBU3201080.1 hypothetical protein [Clostridium estertheticum]WAG66608.1 hypothetical protein LL037_05595 [Clostridium estertheticum]